MIYSNAALNNPYVLPSSTVGSAIPANLLPVGIYSMTFQGYNASGYLVPDPTNPAATASATAAFTITPVAPVVKNTTDILYANKTYFAGMNTTSLTDDFGQMLFNNSDNSQDLKQVPNINPPTTVGVSNLTSPGSVSITAESNPTTLAVWKTSDITQTPLYGGNSSGAPANSFTLANVNYYAGTYYAMESVSDAVNGEILQSSSSPVSFTVTDETALTAKSSTYDYAGATYTPSANLTSMTNTDTTTGTAANVNNEPVQVSITGGTLTSPLTGNAATALTSAQMPAGFTYQEVFTALTWAGHEDYENNHASSESLTAYINNVLANQPTQVETGVTDQTNALIYQTAPVTLTITDDTALTTLPTFGFNAGVGYNGTQEVTGAKNADGSTVVSPFATINSTPTYATITNSARQMVFAGSANQTINAQLLVRDTYTEKLYSLTNKGVVAYQNSGESLGDFIASLTSSQIETSPNQTGALAFESSLTLTVSDLTALTANSSDSQLMAGNTYQAVSDLTAAENSEGTSANPVTTVNNEPVLVSIVNSSNTTVWKGTAADTTPASDLQAGTYSEIYTALTYAGWVNYQQYLANNGLTDSSANLQSFVAGISTSETETTTNNQGALIYVTTTALTVSDSTVLSAQSAQAMNANTPYVPSSDFVSGTNANATAANVPYTTVNGQPTYTSITDSKGNLVWLGTSSSTVPSADLVAGTYTVNDLALTWAGVQAYLASGLSLDSYIKSLVTAGTAIETVPNQVGALLYETSKSPTILTVTDQSNLQLTGLSANTDAFNVNQSYSPTKDLSATTSINADSSAISTSATQMNGYDINVNITKAGQQIWNGAATATVPASDLLAGTYSETYTGLTWAGVQAYLAYLNGTASSETTLAAFIKTIPSAQIQQTSGVNLGLTSLSATDILAVQATENLVVTDQTAIKTTATYKITVGDQFIPSVGDTTTGTSDFYSTQGNPPMLTEVLQALRPRRPAPQQARQRLMITPFTLLSAMTIRLSGQARLTKQSQALRLRQAM